MLLRKIKRNLGKIHVRLTLLFSIILISASIIMFLFSFFSLYTSMKNEDALTTGRRLLNYWAVFQSGGIDHVIEEIKVESYFYGDRAFFVRIADKNNKTLFLKYPQAWEDFDIRKLETLPVEDFSRQVILKSKSRSFNLEVSSVKLSEDYILQIGISTARRVSLLNLYKRNFILLLILLITFSIAISVFLGARAMKPLRDLNNTLTNIVSTGDFSKRVENSRTGDDLEEVITLFNTMLTRIENLILQMKGTLDSVAHDLRTPMTRMRGFAELALQNPEDTKNMEEALSLTLEESDRILSMLNTIMDISEAQSGILHLNLQPIEVKSTLEELIEMYSYIGDNKKLVFKLNCPDNLVIEADPVRFRQAAGNILDNAVKYSPESGNITISVSEDKGMCRISVADQGDGIKEEEIPFIWDRLYRSPSKKNTPGMGLGLSLVKAVVTAHGGRAEVRPLEKGVEFSLYFPIRRSPNITKM